MGRLFVCQGWFLIESLSLLTIQAIRRKCDNQFEEGHIIDTCLELMVSNMGFYKVADLVARIPCLLNCQSPPLFFLMDG